MPHNELARNDREPATDVAHEHAWRTESRHATSQGWVVYVQCVDCRARRVDVQERFDHPPTAVSAAIPRPRDEGADGLESTTSCTLGSAAH